VEPVRGASPVSERGKTMTTLDHRFGTAAVPVVSVSDGRRARGLLAAVTGNAYVRLFAALVVVAAGASGLVVAMGIVLDLVVPVIFGGELRALSSLFPQLSA
jgi:hypothetical protein